MIELKSEPIALPFFITDAWLERTHHILNDADLGAAHLEAKRYQLSTGSSRVDILYRQRKIGWIGLIAAGERLTLFEAYAVDHQNTRKLMVMLAEQFLHALRTVAVKSIEQDTILGPLLDDLRSTIAGSKSLPREPNEPKRGDPIDVWLDWRDAEHSRTDRQISLKRIAEMGNFKHDTVKKRSAERTRQKNEVTGENAPDAP